MSERPPSARSYTRTQRLEDLHASHPEHAADVEALCFALLAARGPLEVMQCHSILGRINGLLEPWVAQEGARANGQGRRDQTEVSAYLAAGRRAKRAAAAAEGREG